ncbi:uncharacterized protein VICG_01694 [Vittaforma corneae ATCC 50505]|uniref:Calponin-homology (CH) domain-containing protein n=1 Tax=Vittaforma corneae (strain ATCC 50505) TaxID=993615 RepID=L2GKE2_VITCO|nr:uncharacterized protein VICG_01694 [Vittaforma corneae ATCC 50505]ELA41321.1 hypothetical protein VICG_01694 [Vittaforma corneae ATCC 50505]
MNPMRITSRHFLLKWLNSVEVPIQKIEDIGKGVALCTLMKKLDQEFPAFKKEPWNENDYMHNLKLVQMFLSKKGVKMYFPIEKMIKLKMQDNLEVIQNIYKFVVRENPALGLNEYGPDRKPCESEANETQTNTSVEKRTHLNNPSPRRLQMEVKEKQNDIEKAQGMHSSNSK